MLDLDALAKEERENWVWHGARRSGPSTSVALVSLSRGGADAAIVREFDLETKSFVKDGYTLPEAKSRVAWRDADSVFVGTDFGPGSMTDSGYPRIVKEWKRGTPLAEATVVFEGRPDGHGRRRHRDLTPGFERDIIIRTPTFWTSECFLRRDGKLVKIEKPDDAALRPAPRVAAPAAPLGLDGRRQDVSGRRRCIAADLEAFLKGSRAFDVLFEPTERRSLGRLQPDAASHHPERAGQRPQPDRGPDPPRRPTGSASRCRACPSSARPSAHAVDPEDSDDYFLDTADFLTPTRWRSARSAAAPPSRSSSSPRSSTPRAWPSRSTRPSRRTARASPISRSARKDLALDGKNPTLLYGYGGFEIPMRPAYRPTVGAAWLEKGGVYVVANIRGGGEFGPKWHQAALKANRHKAYEDFIAVGEDLVRRKVTSPPHLGITGGATAAS